MAAFLFRPLQIFFVDVRFLSRGEHYATETYRVEAMDNFRAPVEAFERSHDSIYDHPLVRALTRVVVTWGD